MWGTVESLSRFRSNQSGDVVAEVANRACDAEGEQVARGARVDDPVHGLDAGCRTRV